VLSYSGRRWWWFTSTVTFSQTRTVLQPEGHNRLHSGPKNKSPRLRHNFVRYRSSIELVVEIMIFKDIRWRPWTLGSLTSCVTWPMNSQYWVSYRWSIWTDRLPITVFEILSFKDIESRPWPFGFTWRHRSCDHWTRKVRFPIGSQYELWTDHVSCTVVEILNFKDFVILLIFKSYTEYTIDRKEMSVSWRPTKALAMNNFGTTCKFDM